MKRPIKTWQEVSAGVSLIDAEASTGPSPVPPADKPATALVYDLRRSNGSSDRFYADVAAFSDRLLAHIDLEAGATVRAYAQYVQSELNESPRTLGDYSIELLTLGLAFAVYLGAAENTPVSDVHLARMLFRLRRLSLLKPAADFLRAMVTRFLLLPQFGRAPAAQGYSLRRLPALIAFLQATGEFEQETARLNNWRSFLSTLAENESARVLDAAVDLFHWFEAEANRALGAYTSGVPAFLAGPYTQRGCREDQVFCGRQPVEYHLNMVAAEIMNRGLQEQFETRRSRVVLVPTCMRGAHAATCRARTVGLDIVCTRCDPDCSVNRISRRMRSLGAKVYLIPHSTGFSRWLDRWQRAPEVGVVAVACMLNILPGGFEMRTRGIASQCVPLDYPGCRKHWSRTGISTGVNQDRLVQIVLGSGG
ncbi:MAG: DUF116 domain-containing protein [Terracidiphilus sp.]